MFRVHVQRSDESTTFTIEGRLTGPWVSELEKCWRDEISAEPARSIAVILAAVSFIDAGGRDLLKRMRRQGATLTAKGCLMQAVVHEIETQANSRASSEGAD